MVHPLALTFKRYVENGSLGQTLKAFGRFNEELAASYALQILEGLHYLHSQEVGRLLDACFNSLITGCAL